MKTLFNTHGKIMKNNNNNFKPVSFDTASSLPHLLYSCYLGFPRHPGGLQKWPESPLVLEG